MVIRFPCYKLCQTSIDSNIQTNKLSSDTDFIIKSERISLDILNFDDNFILEEYDLVNPNNYSLNSISLIYSLLMENISVRSGKDILAYDLDENIINPSNPIVNLTIHFEDGFYNDTTKHLFIEYNLKESLIKESEKYYFIQFTTSIDYFTESLSIDLRLPEKCVLYSKDVDPVSPNPTNYFPQRRIFLQWVHTDKEPGEEVVFIVFFESYSTRAPVWVFIVGPVLGIGAGIIGTYLFMHKRKRKSIKKLGDVFLSRTQKELILIILENGGKIPQVELNEKTSFSKSNISRTLIPLEEKGLVRKEKLGRNFIIYLTEEGYKVIE